MSANETAPGELERSRFELEFEDRFDQPALDGSRWVDHYLPQWTTPERSVARYDLGESGLRLRIDADQPAWRDEDGELRVSNLQTGVFSGPLGSGIGTHRHAPGMTVRTEVPTRRLYTPAGGLVEATLQATADPTCMLAIWLVGLEESSPEDSGEICVAELFGHAIGPGHSRVRLGVKAINDPRLRTDVEDVVLPIDATQPHTYGAEWDFRGVRFWIDGRLVRTVEQRIDYPLQVMVDLFEFPAGPERDPRHYPKSAYVTAVRGYRHRRQRGTA
ncbi:glycoside hydrolase family 16 protein [Planctomonas deserti]|uniref:glycoside hydrolase family 16 protein n=1 Tax=Planctomonas deserti TaxID=2144185 RepID=UPI000D3D0B3D|nr:glycoside hydrolase family 16 protein [Planctomonas deserti]